MSVISTLIIYFVGATVLAYRRASLRSAVIAASVLFLVYLLFGSGSRVLTFLLLVTAAILSVLSFEDLRRRSITRHLFSWFRKALPPISATEQEAIDAGTVWWEGELFTGDPDWSKLLSAGKPQMTAEEKALIDGPVMDLCRMVNPWQSGHVNADVPKEVVEHVRRHKLLGLIIPREYGGLELSAVAQTELLTRVLNTGSVVGNFVLLPNSLGPGELLEKYGTEEQKRRYLPRLASGEEVPCFALTAPLAGSDATAIPDTGVVCRGTWEGEEIVGMRLDFDKRYITLAPIATLVGLAFRLQDPDHLIGDVDDYGITCALIPHSVPGLEIGTRHYPVGDPFHNGPVRGKDVFVPLDFIIGGREMAGKGWRMLVNCLSAGRAISLPSGSNCLAKRALAGAGAYARIRRQFNLSIGQFEGVQKPLARIAGLTYIINAARLHTAQAVAQGSKPAVASAILKYHCTEMARQVINDAMDIHGGKAVMRGPKNYLAAAYEGVPVAITVEGANIMTRSLMIFGQGAIRCHPFVLKEMQLGAAGDGAETDGEAVLREFDRVLFAHAGMSVCNGARAFVHGLTRALSAPVPTMGNPKLRRYYQQVNRLSAAFAAVADTAMLMLQGSLKRREMLSGRLGDLLSMLFLASMVLKHHEDNGCPEEDFPLVQWSCAWLFNHYQEAMHEILQNFPNRLVAVKLRFMVFPTGRHLDRPSDQVERDIAALVTHNTETRRRLVAGIYLEPNDNNPLGQLDALLEVADAVEPLQRRLREAVKAGKVAGRTGDERINAALAVGVLEAGEAETLRDYEARVMEVIQVDEFPFATVGHAAMEN